MALQVHQVSNFDQLIRQLIKAGEGFRGLPYAVNAGSSTGDHTITIGYGYTMVRNGRSGWQRYENLDRDLAAIGITLTVAMYAEIDAVADALDDGRYGDADAAVSRLSVLWAQNFGTLSQPQADTLFGREAQTKLGEIRNKFKKDLTALYNSKDLGETSSTALYNALVNTREMAALLSRAYTGIATIRRDLVLALNEGNRAEAWFVMRYRLTTTAPVNFNGAAARQYAESQVFGLYNDPANVQLDEAQQVYRMLQQNRELIYKHESLYGVNFDGSDGKRNLIRDDNAANSKYRGLLNTYGSVETISEALDRAKAVLLSDLRYKYPELALTSRLDDGQVRSPNIFLNPKKPTDTNRASWMDARPFEGKSYWNDVMIGADQRDIMFAGKGDDDLLGGGGNDALYGGEGSDVLYGDGDNDWLDGGDGNDFIYGGEGEDVIEGGLGNDTLYGGADDDTYRVKAGDGVDTIEDKEGNNKVILNSKVIKLLIRQADGTFKSPEGAFTAEVSGSDLIVTDIASGTKVILNEDFQEGDFGIRFIDTPLAPVTTVGILGDGNGEHCYDANGHLINITLNPQPGQHDLLYDGVANDRIEAMGGNDLIHAQMGGDDWLIGGAGNDVIASQNFGGAASDKDIIEGGAGSDMLWGGPDSDKIFAENAGEMETLIAAGETATAEAGKGELLNGAEGNDFVYGSNRADALFGGYGNDLLIGGGGNDVIFGDDECIAATKDWQFSITPGVNVTPNDQVLMQDYNYKGADTIYAGTGDDFVYAGGGDDEIFDEKTIERIVLQKHRQQMEVVLCG